MDKKNRRDYIAWLSEQKIKIKFKKIKKKKKSKVRDNCEMCGRIYIFTDLSRFLKTLLTSESFKACAKIAKYATRGCGTEAKAIVFTLFYIVFFLFW